MSAVVSLDNLLQARHVWRGRRAVSPPSTQPTGWPGLDQALPMRGWPEAALSEILLAADGVGELQLVLPTLARLTRAAQRVVLVAPPYLPFAPAWQAAGVDWRHVSVIETTPDERAWALEQCLRSGSCAAVLGWLPHVGNKVLRRLEVAAGTGKALGFVFRDRATLAHPSPAALRVEVRPGVLHVRKCRGGHPPAPIAFAAA